MKHKALKTMVVASMLSIGSVNANADAVTAICPLTGPGVAACAAVGTLLHEGVQALNGKKAFGPNGEIMKIIKNPAGGHNSEVRKTGRAIAKVFGW